MRYGKQEYTLISNLQSQTSIVEGLI